jgi:hypothetical protein
MQMGFVSNNDDGHDIDLAEGTFRLVTGFLSGIEPYGGPG